MQLYKEGKVEDAIAMAKKALKADFLQTKAAPGVAVFLLNVQYYQYLGAAEDNDAEKKAKAELLAKVSNTAKSILSMKDWAAKEEGDSARIMLLRLALAKENMAEADKILSEINPNSREYPKALTVMGFQHWFKYQNEPRSRSTPTGQEAGNRQETEIAKRDEDRKQAVDYIEKAVKAHGRAPHARRRLARGPPRIPIVAGRNLQRRRRLQAVRSALQVVVRRHPQGLQQAVRRDRAADLRGAGQAFLKLGDVANAAAIGGKFMELGPDKAPVNVAIMSFAKGLETLRKRALEKRFGRSCRARPKGRPS